MNVKQAKEKQDTVQLTIRLENKQLREAQFYLGLERTNLQTFVSKTLAQFIDVYRREHPEVAAGGVRAIHSPCQD